MGGSLLLYNAQTDAGNSDFISLAVRNRRVELRFNSGSGGWGEDLGVEGVGG